MYDGKWVAGLEKKTRGGEGRRAVRLKKGGEDWFRKRGKRVKKVVDNRKTGLLRWKKRQGGRP